MNMLFKQSFLSSFSHAPKIIPPLPKPKMYEVHFLSLVARRECFFVQTHHPVQCNFSGQTDILS